MSDLPSVTTSEREILGTVQEIVRDSPAFPGVVVGHPAKYRSRHANRGTVRFKTLLHKPKYCSSGFDGPSLGSPIRPHSYPDCCRVFFSPGKILPVLILSNPFFFCETRFFFSPLQDISSRSRNFPNEFAHFSSPVKKETLKKWPVVFGGIETQNKVFRPNRWGCDAEDENHHLN